MAIPPVAPRFIEGGARDTSVARPEASEATIGLQPEKQVERPTGAQTPAGFGDVLAGVVSDAARAGHVADAKSQALAAGLSDDLHGTMISAKEAEISLRLVGTVRNKLIDAFHELWRTSV